MFFSRLHVQCVVYLWHCTFIFITRLFCICFYENIKLFIFHGMNRKALFSCSTVFSLKMALLLGRVCKNQVQNLLHIQNIFRTWVIFIAVKGDFSKQLSIIIFCCHWVASHWGPPPFSSNLQTFPCSAPGVALCRRKPRFEHLLKDLRDFLLPLRFVIRICERLQQNYMLLYSKKSSTKLKGEEPTGGVCSV